MSTAYWLAVGLLLVASPVEAQLTDLTEPAAPTMPSGSHPGACVSELRFGSNDDPQRVDPDPSRARRTEHRYDAEGRETERVLHIGARVDQRHRFRRHADGRLLGIHSTVVGNAGLSQHTSYRYDGRGRLVRAADQSWIVTRTYPSARTVRDETRSSDGGGVTEWRVTRLDARGRIIERVNGPGTQTSPGTRERWVWAGDRLVRRETDVNDDGSVELRVLLRYDAGGNLTEVETRSLGGGFDTLSSRETMSYACWD